MKTIGELVTEIDFKAENKPVETRKIEIDPNTKGIVDNLFKKLQIIFPAFRQAWPTQQEFDRAKREWTIGFMQAGIKNVEQLKFGLKRARLSGQDFVPNVGKFIGWCTPTAEELNLPSLEKAFDEACKNSYRYEINKHWSHPAIYHAWKMCSSCDLSGLPKQSAFQIFEHAYSLTIKSILKGEPLKPIPQAIQHKKDSPINKEVGRSALQPF